MRNLSILGLVFLMFSCTSPERADWDSGANARNSYHEEARQEEVETTRDQIPPAGEPHSEKDQPF
ncbi:MAG TPA: hypothetical protein VNJ08_01365 [Bacteriovoracaceae bacterium]|nr:hypothetical protein [Bacteriovoracaceae bacterium]